MMFWRIVFIACLLIVAGHALSLHYQGLLQ